jgi:hypothetical protein
MNYRLEGLRREANEIEHKLRRDIGLLPADIEVIGALLFIKHQGADKKLSEMLENTAKVIKEAEEFLEKLKNKSDD